MLVTGDVGAVVELNCETDFVAKGDGFGQALAALTKLVVDEGDTETRREDDQRRDRRRLREGPVGHARREDRARPRVPLRDDRRSARRLQAHPERARHRRRARRARRRRPHRREGPRRSRTTSRCTSPSAAPRYVTRDEVPAEEVARERDIYEVQTREEGKPEQAWPKIIEGKLNGFYKTVALVEQSFVKDNKQTIDAVVKSLGADAHVRGFAAGQDRRGIARPNRTTARPRRSTREELPMTTSRYHRVVLKLSGEAFADQTIGFGIDAVVVQRIAEEVTKARADLGVEIAIVVGGGNIFRGLTRRDARHGPRPRRLHGHARHGHQRARAAGRARVDGPADARADRDHDGAGRRAVHPAARDPPPREGPARDLRGRHRQPVLHDRHHRRAARRGDRRGGGAEGHALGRRRRLQRRPAHRSRPR